MIAANNPLNIRVSSSNWQGKTGERKGFVEFDTLSHGYRAAWILLNNYHTIHGRRNLTDILRRFAPPGDGNNTQAYIQHVAQHTGQNPYRTLPTPRDDPQIWIPILTIMTMIEQGIQESQVDQCALSDGYRQAFGRQPVTHSEAMPIT